MKLLLKVVGAVVLVFVVAAVAVPLLVDINQYKPQIQEAVESRTGRKLTLPGDISLSLFPWIAVELGELSLGNAEGFSDEHMLRIEQASASLKLLPLLSGTIEVGTVSLRGLRLHLHIDNSGRSNWEDLMANAEDSPKTASKSVESGAKSADLEKLAIGGLDIADAAVTFIDDRNGSRYEVTDFNLSTGALQPGRPLDIELSLHTTSREPQLDIALEAATTLTLDMAAGTAQAKDLKLTINELRALGELSAESLKDSPSWQGQLEIGEFDLKKLLTSLGPGAPETTDPKALTRVSGTMAVAGTRSSANLRNLVVRVDDTTLRGTITVEDFAAMKLRFDLDVDDLDADRYRAPVGEDDGATAKTSDSGDQTDTDINATPVDLSALNGVDIRGKARLGRLKLSDFEFTDLTTTAAIANGKASLSPMTLSLYGGKLTGSIVANSSGGQSLAIKQALSNLQFEPLTTAATGKRKLSGTGNLTLDLTTGGKTVGDLRQRLNGSIALDARDGAVYGFDISRMLAAARAKRQGESGTAALRANNSPDAVQKTDFDSLTATARIVNGLLSNQDLLLTSPDFRAAGKGTAHLYTEVLNYDADVTVLETRQTAENQELQEISGTTVPFEVRGTFADPKVRVALDKIAKQKAKAKVDEKKDELREKAREKIFNKLFN